ncbi:hypothetical protein FBU30_008379 [Linnemannia zychae]|nr:hypothetical protein FBU30_008379 [Linnemannia zychae]
MAFTLFSATTQALPMAPHHEAAVALLKRGGGSTGNLIDAVVNLFVKAETKIVVDACVDLKAKVCADVDVKLNAKGNILGLIQANIDIKKLEVSAKADVNVGIKADIDADVKALVTANIDAHVRAVVLKICPKGDRACLKDYAHSIVAKVAALIKIDVDKLAAKIKADVHAQAKLRLDAIVKKLSINILLAKVDISGIVKVHADIDAHLKAFVDACAKLLVDAKLIGDIGAL